LPVSYRFIAGMLARTSGRDHMDRYVLHFDYIVHVIGQNGRHICRGKWQRVSQLPASRLLFFDSVYVEFLIAEKPSRPLRKFHVGVVPDRSRRID
jgi:hypothetical protein